MQLKYIVKNNELNINQILQNEQNISSRLLYKLIKNERILLNRNICDTRNYANTGDVLIVDFDYEEDNSNIVPCAVLTSASNSINFSPDLIIEAMFFSLHDTHGSLVGNSFK